MLSLECAPYIKLSFWQLPLEYATFWYPFRCNKYGKYCFILDRFYIKDQRFLLQSIPQIMLLFWCISLSQIVSDCRILKQAAVSTSSMPAKLISTSLLSFYPYYFLACCIDGRFQIGRIVFHHTI